MSSLLKCTLLKTTTKSISPLGVYMPVRWKRIVGWKPYRVYEDDTLQWTEPLRKAQEEGRLSQEPKIAPPLHVIRRVKTMKGRPWWEKKVMIELGLDGEVGDPVIHKNSPEINELLFQVKHLIQIQPLTFPHGLPQNEEDLKHTQLRVNGEMIIKRDITGHESSTDSEPTTAQKRHQKWSMSDETLQKELDYQKDRHKIHMEYFKAKYLYKNNQDGKEYRYTFNKI